MSNGPEQSTGQPKSAVTNRAMETAVAAIALLIGIVVIVDSWRLGARWGSDGPQAGYFPFYIGLFLCAGSLSVMAAALRRRTGSGIFLTFDQLKRVLTLLLPLTAFVVLIKPLGLYLASTLFVAYFMFAHGKHRLWISVVVGLGTGLAGFVSFEVLLGIPLIKGPVEAVFGFH